jgi:glycosyltransferase involved in cell wall biosynthesis
MSKPVVASYCPDFLKSDMQHIYRQISDLREWEARVITHRRENEALFPWPRKKIRVLRKHPLRLVRRLWHRQLHRRPVPPTLGEIKEFLYQAFRFDARLLHIYFGHIAVQWLPLMKACPLPVVVSFHGADVGVGVESAQLREVFRCARLILARSRALIEDLRVHGCPMEKLRLQRTGIPTDFWLPPPNPRLFPPANGAWQFVQACRLVEKKGVTTTLRAFAKIIRTHPNARLTLIGDGPLRSALEVSARELGITRNLTFAGFLPPEKIRHIFHAAHAFFHPSVTTADGNREGVPNSLLEAMATGLPALATKHGGIPEAIEDGVSGFLVDEGDADGLASAALRLTTGDVNYDAVSRAARNAVLREFERSTQTAVLEACYNEAASTPRAKSPCKTEELR